MARTFNNEIFYQNVRILLAKKNKKIGELESNCEVHAGYMSRVLKADMKPSIDVIIKIANYFTVRVETLLFEELKKYTVTELYILRFLDKVIRDTEDEKIHWKTALQIKDSFPVIANMFKDDLTNYYLQISDTVFLVVRRKESNNYTEAIIAYDNGVTQDLCSKSDQLWKTIMELRNTAERSMQSPQISPAARMVIDAFMSGE